MVDLPFAEELLLQLRHRELEESADPLAQEELLRVEIRAQVERSQLSFRALEVERLDARRSSPLQARPRLALVGGVPFPCKRVAVRLR